MDRGFSLARELGILRGLICGARLPALADSDPNGEGGNRRHYADADESRFRCWWQSLELSRSGQYALGSKTRQIER